jgi:uncharacterized membrane protein (DUF373 family)
MRLNEAYAAAAARWRVIVILSALITLVIAMAIWTLVLKLLSIILSSGFDPTDYEVFQTLFGMIMTVIIALEFQRSLVVITGRRLGIVQVRTVVLIALLAVVRKLLILDLASTDATLLFGLAAATLALGAVYRLVGERDGGERV